MMSKMNDARTALTVRCSQQDAKALHMQAASEHRSISGCLLNVLDRYLAMEEGLVHGLPDSLLEKKAREFRLLGPGEAGARILLRCFSDEANRIRAAAAKRQMGVSNFIVFCLRRHWQARLQLNL